MRQSKISTSPNAFNRLSPRLRQIARALASPHLGLEWFTEDLLAALACYDDDARIDRSLEPEWLVAETLMAICHDRKVGGQFISNMLVGDIANEVNQKLHDHHEDVRLSAKKVGMVLKSLGLSTTRLGRSGRGFTLTADLKRKIHEIAAHLGIDRRALATMWALQTDYGGAQCDLCEEFGVAAGLRFTKEDLFPDPN